VVTPGYFETMGIPLIRGRTFNEADVRGGRLVAVVDEVLARKYWPGQEAIGRRVGYGQDSTGQPRWFEVVGVVGHVMQNSPRDDEHTQLYRPLSQSVVGQLGFAVKTRSDPAAMTPAIRKLVLSLDPQQPIFMVEPMAERVSGSSSQPRFLSLLLGLFAAVAATLAAVGIYGVMSYAVIQRTQEIGIRMALGAEREHIVRMVLRSGTVMALCGVGIGLVTALGLARLITTLLFQTSPADLPTFSVVPLVLLGVALLACYLPARRATKVDPSIALRYE
jgi:putative ABC transport system permease protein